MSLSLEYLDLGIRYWLFVLVGGLNKPNNPGFQQKGGEGGQNAHLPPPPPPPPKEKEKKREREGEGERDGREVGGGAYIWVIQYT